ncbi:unnamed protein product, partial [Polarella glacialis]
KDGQYAVASWGEFKSADPYRTDLFAPNSLASTSRVVDLRAVKKKHPTFTFDLTNAFFHAPEDEECYVDPPAEWLDEEEQKTGARDWMWRLIRQLYGRRKAPRHFLKYAAGVLKGFGCEQCPLKRPASLGTQDETCYWSFAWTMAMARALLARIRTAEGMYISGNTKHVENLIKLLDLVDCKVKPTPMVKRSAGIELAEPSKLYRRCVGILLFFNLDRGDIQYCVKELSQSMSAPTELAFAKLKHLVRYLSGSRDYSYFFPVEAEAFEIDARSDTDWAGCLITRRSTTCGSIMVGDCVLYDFCRAQAIVALSSAESEFFGGVSVASEALFVQVVLYFAGIHLTNKLSLDSSAARAILTRS